LVCAVRTSNDKPTSSTMEAEAQVPAATPAHPFGRVRAAPWFVQSQGSNWGVSLPQGQEPGWKVRCDWSGLAHPLSQLAHRLCAPSIFSGAKPPNSTFCSARVRQTANGVEHRTHAALLVVCRLCRVVSLVSASCPYRPRRRALVFCSCAALLSASFLPERHTSDEPRNRPCRRPVR